MKKYIKFSQIILLGAALLFLSSCGRQPTPTPVLPVPVEPSPAPLEPFEFPLPESGEAPLFDFPPTPTPIVIVAPPSPTPMVVVVTATPQVVFILPETGADLSVQPSTSLPWRPLALMVLGGTLVAFGLFNRRRG